MSLLADFLDEPKIAYFSMEIGLRKEIPTYSGGLGVLAGDTIKSSADLKLPLIAVTLLSRKGFFEQDITPEGRQVESPSEWEPSDLMKLLPEKVTVEIEGREVFVRAWLYIVESIVGGRVPVLFLDTDMEENSPEDRTITDYLYGGDRLYRLKQEIVLGIGGVRILGALGFEIKKYHMNEGHAAFLTLELLKRHRRSIEEVWDEKLIWDTEKVRSMCVFTTHTPIEAGHDRFSFDLVEKCLGDFIPLDVLRELGGEEENLNMTILALNLSDYVNGVAKKHRDVSRVMFPGYEIHAITNGVHSFTWTSDSFKRLFDGYFPGWANEPELLVRVEKIPHEEIWQSHMDAKKSLIDYVNETTGTGMNHDTLTIGFARRATAYKRGDLLFRDVERLKKIAGGKVQIVYAGKAHPQDEPGKKTIERIFSYIGQLRNDIKITYLKNYNMDIALRMVSGVDVWLNTPLRPLEASGTSGMKAAHNGVLNFSVLDGWWIEGYIEGYTGWSIGAAPSELIPDENAADRRDSEDLYKKLEHEIIPLYYNDRDGWIRMMQHAVGKIAYYFNTHRMMRRYVTEGYL